MPFTLAVQLARRAPVVQADTALGLVAENLRESNGGVVAVLDRVTPDRSQFSERSARLVGIITQDDLATASARVFAPTREVASLNGHGANALVEQDGEALASAPPSPLDTLRELKARDVMRVEVPFVPAQFSLPNALLTFDRAGLGSLPVLDEANRYLGMLSRADVLSALTGYVRPPVVGGMATPLGVWLTDGVLTGGVSAFGLFLSGLTIAAFFYIAQLAVYFVARAINPEFGMLVLSGRLGLQNDSANLLNTFFAGLHALFFLLMFRLTPLAGVHAAEHQTVHALERGLPLTPENVAKMPRAHPRCGTNLMAIAGLIYVGITHLSALTPDWILGLLIFTFFVWRSFGDVLQVLFTTRPASKKQLESGIRAAQQLMAHYQNTPFMTSRSPLRLLNAGMMWSFAGSLAGGAAFTALFQFAATVWGR